MVMPPARTAPSIAAIGGLAQPILGVVQREIELFEEFLGLDPRLAADQIEVEAGAEHLVRAADDHGADALVVARLRKASEQRIDQRDAECIDRRAIEHQFGDAVGGGVTNEIGGHALSPFAWRRQRNDFRARGPASSDAWFGKRHQGHDFEGAACSVYPLPLWDRDIAASRARLPSPLRGGVGGWGFTSEDARDGIAQCTSARNNSPSKCAQSRRRPSVFFGGDCAGILRLRDRISAGRR